MQQKRRHQASDGGPQTTQTGESRPSLPRRGLTLLLTLPGRRGLIIFAWILGPPAATDRSHQQPNGKQSHQDGGRKPQQTPTLTSLTSRSRSSRTRSMSRRRRRPGARLPPAWNNQNRQKNSSYPKRAFSATATETAAHKRRQKWRRLRRKQAGRHQSENSSRRRHHLTHHSTLSTAPSPVQGPSTSCWPPPRIQRQWSLWFFPHRSRTSAAFPVARLGTSASSASSHSSTARRGSDGL